IHGGLRRRGLHRRRRTPHRPGTRPCARPHHAGARVCARPVLPPRPRMEERRMTLTIYNAADIPQGSDAWLEARRGIVTASTVGKLLTSTGKIANNDTSRTLIETLAIERITGRVEYIHPSRDMQRGTLLEPTARELYEQHPAPVDEVGFIRTELGVGTRLGYSPDGLVGDEGLLEIKSRTPRIQARTIRLGEVPAANMAQ